MSRVLDTLPVASKRLVTLSLAAPLVEAARLLSEQPTHLIVVCNTQGLMQGVVTKSDVVRQISHCTGCSCTTQVSDVMTRDVISCRPEQSLREVWGIMKEKGLKQIPVADQRPMPLGLLYANEALEALLNHVSQEELQLREYVMGIGYH
ncbi:CBS domain-containing protein [Yanghanlia caeni]|uniref:CBS domain-containing protein n=1 Tax=Yanghanlia caeni TaxID=3064283 RepID=A0ABU1D2F4_9BURK|nr:CBS domain-containing protein [Alcaligenaceae bacterium LG-2]NGR07800.1 CBS domain-containing protein [bacterium SGD-2]HZH57325.1 CBS domain-containing protein [Burkholderiaceae bacterium]